MDNLLRALQSFPSWKDALRLSCRENSIKTSLANTLTPLKMKSLYERLVKTYDNNEQKAKTAWLQNQLRAYHWILIVLSAVNRNEAQWDILTEIFKHKETHVLEYEAIRLNPKKQEIARLWDREDEKLQTNKWNEVARTLFKSSQRKFYRTGKQCRERWLNHLDPNKKRGQWSEEQDRVISTYIIDQGKKWSEIAKALGDSRTEHMVKNRFKSLLIRQKKRYPSLRSQNDLLKSIIIGDVIKNQPSQSFQDIDRQEQHNGSKNKVRYDDKMKEKLIQQKPLIYVQKQFKKSIVGSLPKSERSDRDRLSPGCDLTQLDPILRTEMIISENDDRSNKHSQLQQVYSPFVMAYTPTANLTPSYLSPPPSIPFFMSSFGQSCMNNFNFFLSHQSGSTGGSQYNRGSE